MLYVFAIVTLLAVVGAPSLLVVLLAYHGEKSRREEAKARVRGFEVNRIPNWPSGAKAVDDGTLGK